MRRMKQLQTGGVGSWIFIILVFGGSLSMGLKLVPLYMNHNTMSSVLDAMAEEDGLAARRTNDLQQMMMQRFKMNNIREFDVKENVEIKRSSNGTEIIMDYEVRIPLVQNLDLIAAFEKSVELRK
jgi:hypothetical protein